MPISSSEIEEAGYPGYAPICSTVTKAVYALFVSEDDGEPVDGYEGSAFAVSSDGLLLTATHVLESIENKAANGNRRIALARDTSPFELNEHVVIGVDIVEKFNINGCDISVISADIDTLPSYEYLKVRTGGMAESMGQPVAAFGYPINESVEEWNVSQRTLSGVISNINMFGNSPTYEVDTLFHPGLSGGPVISLRQGDVIGVVHARGSYLDEFQSEPFPAPSHLSEAKLIPSDESGNVNVGQKLENHGICYRHEN